jgi:P-type Cu+ transporter
MQDHFDEAVHLSVEGMTCTGCVKAVTNALSQVSGVTAVTVDLGARHARVEGRADPQSLLAAVERAGLGVRLAQDTKEEGSRGHRV